MLTIPDELKRSLDEAYTLYYTNPTLKDIFVEGASDKVLIESFLRSCGLTSPVIKTAELVNISSRDLTSQKLHAPSNRSKIVYLSHALENRGITGANVLCVADQDFEPFIPTPLKSTVLAFSDFADMEIYFFDVGIVSEFLVTTFRISGIDAGKLIVDLTDILNYLYFTRVVLLRRKWNFEVLSPIKDLECRDDAIALNKDGYSLRLLMKIGQTASITIFRDEVDKLMKTAFGDRRLAMRGHDFSEILLYYCHKKKSKPALFSCHEGVEACLRLAVKKEHLLNFLLFQRLGKFAA